ncbi:DMT family transporter [Alginatibacterium sediminis]|uniref:DMT family transporter n=1 Tax=Alginatibacterium sediminis TaxID=2164068 RepID=A0A420EH74_9ALTE|nr:DMT family transporter [Alginatibacterium sediminis]RKF20018.1 DMT family transporter [Alginatibacterium sediminis]
MLTQKIQHEPAAKTINTNRVFGTIAALLTALIWALFFTGLKVGLSTNMQWYDIAFFRYVLPSILLTPILFWNWKRISQAPVIYLFGMSFGSGLPFLFLGVGGMQSSSITVASTVIPALAPIFLALLHSFDPKVPKLGLVPRLCMVSILVCVAVLVASNIETSLASPSLAVLLLLSAACCWAIFTFCFKKSGLAPLNAATWVLCSNAIVWFALLLVVDFPALELMSWTDIALQTLIQAIAVAIVACVLYAYAIRQIGPQIAAATGALAPVIASVLGFYFLAEHPSTTSVAAMLMVVISVIIFNLSPLHNSKRLITKRVVVKAVSRYTLPYKT